MSNRKSKEKLKVPKTESSTSTDDDEALKEQLKSEEILAAESLVSLSLPKKFFISPIEVEIPRGSRTHIMVNIDRISKRKSEVKPSKPAKISKILADVDAQRKIQQQIGNDRLYTELKDIRAHVLNRLGELNEYSLERGTTHYKAIIQSVIDRLFKKETIESINSNASVIVTENKSQEIATNIKESKKNDNKVSKKDNIEKLEVENKEHVVPEMSRKADETKSSLNSVENKIENALFTTATPAIPDAKSIIKQFKCEICGTQKSRNYGYKIRMCRCCRVFFERKVTSTVQEINDCRCEDICEINENLKSKRELCRTCRFKKHLVKGCHPLDVDDDLRNYLDMQPNDALNYLVMLGIKDFKMNNQKAKTINTAELLKASIEREVTLLYDWFKEFPGLNLVTNKDKYLLLSEKALQVVMFSLLFNNEINSQGERCDNFMYNFQQPLGLKNTIEKIMRSVKLKCDEVLLMRAIILFDFQGVEGLQFINDLYQLQKRSISALVSLKKLNEFDYVKLIDIKQDVKEFIEDIKMLINYLIAVSFDAYFPQ